MTSCKHSCQEVISKSSSPSDHHSVLIAVYWVHATYIYIYKHDNKQKKSKCRHYFHEPVGASSFVNKNIAPSLMNYTFIFNTALNILIRKQNMFVYFGFNYYLQFYIFVIVSLFLLVSFIHFDFYYLFWFLLFTLVFYFLFWFLFFTLVFYSGFYYLLRCLFFTFVFIFYSGFYYLLVFLFYFGFYY